MYRRREQRGRGAGEIEKITQHCQPLRNISKSKKRKEAGANNNRAETGAKGYGKREVQPPPRLPP